MVDVVDRATRSRMMSGIRAKNTHPELFIRQGLHVRGFRYRLHVKNIPGKPDMVFPKYNAIIEVHGCFWHGHEGCPKAKLPASNRAFWADKLARNRDRDRQACEALEAGGWHVETIWDCELAADGAINARLGKIPRPCCAPFTVPSRAIGRTRNISVRD